LGAAASGGGAMSEFFYMGGYGAFVWPAYGLTLVVLVGNVLLPRLRHQRILNHLRQGGSERESISQPTVRHVP